MRMARPGGERRSSHKTAEVARTQSPALGSSVKSDAWIEIVDRPKQRSDQADPAKYGDRLEAFQLGPIHRKVLRKQFDARCHLRPPGLTVIGSEQEIKD